MIEYPYELLREKDVRIAELEAENKRLLTDVEATARHANMLSDHSRAPEYIDGWGDCLDAYRALIRARPAP